MTDEQMDQGPGGRPIDEELASALTEHASRFEPQPNSYMRLQRSIEDTQQAPPRRLPGRYLSAAAVLFVAVGAAAYVATNAGGQEIQTLPPAQSSTTEVAPSTTEPPAPSASSNNDATATGVAPTTTEASETNEVADSLIAGPRRMTKQQAAEDFMALIRLPFARIEVDGDLATVFSFDPDGEPGGAVSELLLVETQLSNGQPGFAVARATSAAAAISSPLPGQKIESGTVIVTGSGQGFEANVGVRIFSSFDGLLFDSNGAIAGNFGDVAPFETELTVTGREYGWIVAQSGGGADGVTEPFSAVPIEWDAGLDSTTYTVSHIPPDDPDGGLNLRNLPTVDESTVLDTLPAGTTGLRRRGDVPAFVDGQVFWAVSTADGKDGWVNRRFLVREDEVAPEVLESMASGFLNEFATFGGQFAEFQPWTTSKPVVIGWPVDMMSLDSATVRSADFWSQEQNWTVPEEAFSTPTVSATFADLLGFPLSSDEANTIGYSFISEAASIPVSSPYGSVQPALESQLTGLARVHVVPTSDFLGNDYPAFTLYVESGPNGPAIVGVTVDFWIP